MLTETLKNLENQAQGWVSRSNFQSNTTELANKRASTFVTIKNLESDPKAWEFEIPYHVSGLWDYSASVIINLPQMPDSCPVSHPCARPWAMSFFRKTNISMTVLLQKEQKHQKCSLTEVISNSEISYMSFWLVGPNLHPELQLQESLENALDLPHKKAH